MENNSTFLTITLPSQHTSVNRSDQHYIPYSDRPETYIVPVVFAIIFIVGVLGNGILLLIFLQKKSMRTVPNTFIASLAVGDLFVLSGAVPFTAVVYVLDSWPFGETLCKISEFLREVSAGVTVLTLMVLSIDRYLAVSFPMPQKHGGRSGPMIRTVTLGLWVGAVCVAAPSARYSFLWQVAVGNDKMVTICYPYPPHMIPWYPRTMILVKFCLLYTMPLAVIACCHALMAHHLLLSARGSLASTSKTNVRTRTKVARMVLALVAIFAVCFFPSHVFMLWFYFHPNADALYSSFWHAWKIVGYTLVFANSCLNPVALCCISSVFRAHFRRYLCFFCIRKEKHHRRSTSRTTSTQRSTSTKISATTRM